LIRTIHNKKELFNLKFHKIKKIKKFFLKTASNKAISKTLKIFFNRLKKEGKKKETVI